MTLETFLLWVAVGAIAGFLASLVVGTGFGMLGDIIIGVVGAFLGGWIFRSLGWHAPFSGLAGTVVIAFLGAVLLMLVLRVARRRRA
ncbi:MAG TPA: GlsB/YeaQ/YmgE family stress response membrane protein [Myxococcaceae bacterium]|nr:GlsB/YeaQ/YmgE family stress response membrane protein [Myxococcaceae bacterium]